MSLSLFPLLVAYGVCFGLQNKTLFLHRGKFLKSLFQCSYCTGFHSGWFTWMVLYLLGQWGRVPLWRVPLHAVVFALASAGFCYLVDTCLQWIESQTRG